MSDESADRAAGTDGGTTATDERTGGTARELWTRWQRIRERETTVVALTVIGVALFPYLFARAPIVSSTLQGYQELASLMLIWGIFALGFNLLLGYTGLLSFGHAAFWGIAAYTAGWVSANLVGSPVVLVLAGTLVAVLLAWVIGFLSLRRGGIYFAILTLAFAQMIYFIALGPLSTLTGGENGFTGVEIAPLFGVFDLGGELPSVFGILLGDWMYVFVGALLVLSVAVLYRVLNSPYGLVFRAIRENEQRAEFVGLNVWRYKLMSFVISGAFAGVAGALFTIHGSYVPLESLYWTTSGEIVIMTVLGGVGSFMGPLIGAGIYLYVEVIVSGFETIGPFWHLILGLVFVVVVLLFPRGVWGLITDARERVATELREDRQ